MLSPTFVSVVPRALTTMYCAVLGGAILSITVQSVVELSATVESIHEHPMGLSLPESDITEVCVGTNLDNFSPTPAAVMRGTAKVRHL